MVVVILNGCASPPPTAPDGHFDDVRPVEALCRLEVENEEGTIEMLELPADVSLEVEEPFVPGAGQETTLGFRCGRTNERTYLYGYLAQYHGPGAYDRGPPLPRLHSTGHAQIGLRRWGGSRLEGLGCVVTVTEGPAQADRTAYREPLKADIECLLETVDDSFPERLRIRGTIVAVPRCLEQSNPISDPGSYTSCPYRPEVDGGSSPGDAGPPPVECFVEAAGICRTDGRGPCGVSSLSPECTPRCSAATATALRACDTGECQEQAFAADTTPSVEVTVSMNGVESEQLMGCSNCLLTQQLFCASIVCPFSAGNAFDRCLVDGTTDGCRVELASLSECIARSNTPEFEACLRGADGPERCFAR